MSKIKMARKQPQQKQKHTIKVYFDYIKDSSEPTCYTLHDVSDKQLAVLQQLSNVVNSDPDTRAFPYIINIKEVL